MYIYVQVCMYVYYIHVHIYSEASDCFCLILGILVFFFFKRAADIQNTDRPTKQFLIKKIGRIVLVNVDKLKQIKRRSSPQT